MGLIDYISRQPNQKPKVTSKYAEEFAVSTITRIADKIAAFYINSTPLNCQSQHFNSIHHTHFTRASYAQQTNNSNLFSALISRTNQLLLNTTVNDPLFQTENKFNMSASNTTPQTPSASPTEQVTFQANTISGVNSTHSSNEGNGFPNLELSDDVIFEKKIPTQLFTKGFLTVLTSKDAVLKEVRDCILEGDEQRCKDVNPYLHSIWRDLHVHSGCDERVAIPNSIQDPVLESLNLTYPGSWDMTTLGLYEYWPYMHREIIYKAAECRVQTVYGVW